MRAIDADALIKTLETTSIFPTPAWLRAVIIDAPTIEPDRKKGAWTVKEGELAFWDVCSVCRKVIIHMVPHYNFCPNCGADMRGEQE